MERLAFLLQVSTTLPLVGLIWLVQIVAYPLFAQAAGPGFAEYHAAHSRFITWVVGPLMAGELVGSLASALVKGSLLPKPLAWSGLLLTAALWLATLLVSVPQHQVLALGFDERAWKTLVATNWIRTALWSLRGGLLVWAVARALPLAGPPIKP